MSAPFAFVVGRDAAFLADSELDLPGELLPGVKGASMVTCSDGALLVIGSASGDPKRESLAAAVEDRLDATAGC